MDKASSDASIVVGIAGRFVIRNAAWSTAKLAAIPLIMGKADASLLIEKKSEKNTVVNAEKSGYCVVLDCNIG